MPQMNDTPEPFYPGQGLEQISSANLNRIVNAVITQLRGGKNTRVSNYGNRVSVDSSQIEPQLPDQALYMTQFVVLEELDDWLVCTPFVQPNDGSKWIPQDFDPELEKDTQVRVLVAKPYALQKTPWHGIDAHYNGWTIHFNYTALGSRTLTCTRDPGDVDHPNPPDHFQAGTYNITPGYHQGDIILASRNVTGHQEADSTPVGWEDMNRAGRNWALESATDTTWEQATQITSGPLNDWVPPTPNYCQKPTVERLRLSGTPVITGIQAPPPGAFYPLLLWNAPGGAPVVYLIGSSSDSMSDNQFYITDQNWIGQEGDMTLGSADITSFPNSIFDFVDILGLPVFGPGINTAINTSVVSYDDPTQTLTLSDPATLTLTNTKLWFLGTFIAIPTNWCALLLYDYTSQFWRVWLIGGNQEQIGGGKPFYMQATNVSSTPHGVPFGNNMFTFNDETGIQTDDGLIVTVASDGGTGTTVYSLKSLVNALKTGSVIAP